jgi:signal transduction histidine kinase
MLFGDTPPLFAEDDVATLTALSTPVAAAIQNWQLTEERAAAAAFEESLALERDFLAAAAHELRTPLTSILGEAQLLSRRLASDAIERARDNATHIALQATRMRDLVNDLLSVARDSAGFVDELEEDDVFAIASAIGRDFPNVRIEGEQAIAEVDRRRIGQVVRNLLDNASKYSPGGAPVDLRVHPVEDHVVIEVEDRGIGVPASERTRIFERFVRGASTQHSETEGMGLGLYLCNRIIEEHGGTIRVESGSEGGSLFIVSLPTTHPDDDVHETLGISAPAPRQLEPEVAGATNTTQQEAAAQSSAPLV